MVSRNSVPLAKPVETGPARVLLELRARGFTQEAWATANGFVAPQVSMCINGHREYPEIRDALARFLKISRSIIDGWIDGPE